MAAFSPPSGPCSHHHQLCNRNNGVWLAKLLVPSYAKLPGRSLFRPIACRPFRMTTSKNILKGEIIGVIDCGPGFEYVFKRRNIQYVKKIEYTKCNNESTIRIYSRTLINLLKIPVRSIMGEYRPRNYEEFILERSRIFLVRYNVNEHRPVPTNYRRAEPRILSTSQLVPSSCVYD